MVIDLPDGFEQSIVQTQAPSMVKRDEISEGCRKRDETVGHQENLDLCNEGVKMMIHGCMYVDVCAFF